MRNGHASPLTPHFRLPDGAALWVVGRGARARARQSATRRRLRCRLSRTEAVPAAAPQRERRSWSLRAGA